MILCSTHTIFCSWHGNTRKNLGSNKNARIWLFHQRNRQFTSLEKWGLNWLNYWWSAGPRQSMLAIWAQMERGTITVIVNTRLGAIRPRIRSAPHNLIANALPGLDAMQCMAISWSLTKTGSFVVKLLVVIATNFQRHGGNLKSQLWTIQAMTKWWKSITYWRICRQREFVNICTSRRSSKLWAHLTLLFTAFRFSN